MSYKDILVYMSGNSAHSAALNVAAQIATRHEGHVNGLHLRLPSEVPTFVMTEIGSQIKDAQRDAVQGLADKTKAEFMDVVSDAPFTSAWLEQKGDEVTLLPLYARRSDICIVGAGATKSSEARDTSLIEQLMLSAGRPVLMVPEQNQGVDTAKSCGDVVLVAWNASRESVRAVHDAMPFLKRAKEVHVVVGRVKDSIKPSNDVDGLDICTALKRHGVNVVERYEEKVTGSVGKHLLAKAETVHADLIVMGGYGRPRMREIVLGGVTHYVLKHTCVPVMLSH
jgi:nucleotide-binding universal stress UspA family protein